MIDAIPMTSTSGRENWHSLKLLPPQGSDPVVAGAKVPAGSPWFSGHFPGEPILPGIAQIALVFEAIGLARGKALKISGLKRIRFKQIIEPDDKIELYASPQKNNDLSYSFRIMVRDELACSGILITECLDS
jgi:3-hydroxymyristoyl/3-hydroxydecanoyl-(acyl carrier protein) dehydratase